MQAANNILGLPARQNMPQLNLYEQKSSNVNVNSKEHKRERIANVAEENMPNKRLRYDPENANNHSMQPRKALTLNDFEFEKLQANNQNINNIEALKIQIKQIQLQNEKIRLAQLQVEKIIKECQEWIKSTAEQQLELIKYINLIQLQQYIFEPKNISISKIAPSTQPQININEFGGKQSKPVLNKTG